DTTVVTYMAFPSLGDDPSTQLALAQNYAKALGGPGRSVAVTGALAGQLQESQAITDALPWVTLASLCLIALILGLYFRSLLAPLVTLAATGIAYAIAIRVV